MKKTLLITHEYYPFHGGVARYCYELFRRLPSESVDVLSDQDEGKGEQFQYMRFTDPIRPSWLFGFVRVLWFSIRNRIKILVTPNILPLGSIAYMINRVFKIPYVISLHGLDILTALKHKKEWTLEILSKAHHLIANSEATKRAIPESVKTPVTVITPYAEKGNISEGAIPEMYMSKKLILTVGRLVKRKGQAVVIEAIDTLKNLHPDLHYVILGDGPERERLETMIREKKLQNYVSILPGASDEEVVSFMKHASAFVMPTIRIDTDVEGFGIVFIEATRAGIPIIAGDSWAEKEALGEHGAIYVDGARSDAVAQAIEKLLSDRSVANTFVAHAKAHVASLPDWDSQAKKLEQILQ